MNPPIPGRRHNSFFALGIVAYIQYEEALEAIPIMMDRNLHIGFTIEEAYSAEKRGLEAISSAVKPLRA